MAGLEAHYIQGVKTGFERNQPVPALVQMTEAKMKCNECDFENPSHVQACENCGIELTSPEYLYETQPLPPTQEGEIPEALSDKYQIIGTIGKGGMGNVYEALDKRLKRTVALKFLSPALNGDPNARKQFIREARAASALDHPNICTIYEIDETENNQIFISMAYYQGQSLRERMKDSTLSLKETLDVAIPVARGLAKAHAKGIVHRDIKPGNIYMTTEGEVKILDFGLAKLASESGHVSTGAAGTVFYMSPEQIRGEDADHMADIWSLGTVVYEMLTGRPPFDGNSAAEVMQNVVNNDAEPPSKLRPEIPIELERIVTKALNKDPHSRYRSTDDLVASLVTIREALETPERDARSSIAVLPFLDMSPKKDQEHFCEGIAEELTNSLAKISHLDVASRTSAFKYRESDLDIREIGHQLGVATVLEGSVRKAGDTLRITAQLISIADGYHIWSESYDREVKDVFAIQDEIAQNIVQALEVTLTSEERQSIQSPATTDVEAYDYYLRGRRFYYQYRRKAIELALQMFTLAIKHDPSYALAYAGIADCCAFLFLYADRSAESLRKADQASLRALELNPELAEAHASRGQVLSLSQKHIEAEAEFEEAIRLGPRLFGAYYFYARDSFAQGKLEKATQLYEKASEISPDDYQSPLLSAQIYMDLGQQSKADASRRRGVQMVEGRLHVDPGDVRALYLGANGLMGLGEIEKGLEWATLALTMDPKEPMVLYNVACIYAMAGRIEDALDCAERAAEAGLSQKEWYEHDANLDPLRSHPRFKALLERLK
jgi:serine/threonine protein kinase/cytochrome c-type biogenesis protein CcmH/NrfG